MSPLSEFYSGNWTFLLLNFPAKLLLANENSWLKKTVKNF